MNPSLAAKRVSGAKILTSSKRTAIIEGRDKNITVKNKEQEKEERKAKREEKQRKKLQRIKLSKSKPSKKLLCRTKSSLRREHHHLNLFLLQKDHMPGQKDAPIRILVL